MATIEWQKPSTRGNLLKNKSKPLKIRKQKLALHCSQPKSLTLLPQNRCSKRVVDCTKNIHSNLSPGLRLNLVGLAIDIKSKSKYLYIILLYLFVYHCIVNVWISLQCLVSLDVSNTNHDCVMIREWTSAHLCCANESRWWFTVPTICLVKTTAFLVRCLWWI